MLLSMRSSGLGGGQVGLGGIYQSMNIRRAFSQREGVFAKADANAATDTASLRSQRSGGRQMSVAMVGPQRRAFKAR